MNIYLFLNIGLFLISNDNQIFTLSIQFMAICDYIIDFNNCLIMKSKQKYYN